MVRAVNVVSRKQIKNIICAVFLNECDLAIRVFTQESNLNSKAIGDHGNSIGIAQIHLPAHKNKVNCDLFEPECNIRLAKQIRDSSGWGAWSVYRNKTF